MIGFLVAKRGPRQLTVTPCRPSRTRRRSPTRAACPPGPLARMTPLFAEDAAPGIPPLLSVVEVAALFHRSARTLRRWERDGHLTPLRVGGAVFYRATDIRDLVAGRLLRTKSRCGRNRPSERNLVRYVSSHRIWSIDGAE